MTGICKSQMPNGQSECTVAEAKYTYMIVDRLDVSFANEESFLSLADNVAFVSTPQNNQLRSYIFKIADYEPGTAEPGIATLDNTRMIQLNFPIPNGVFYPDLSFCDNADLAKVFLGGQYRVRLVTALDQIKATQLADGTIRGFKASITHTTTGLAMKADPDKEFGLRVFFSSYAEFKNSILRVPEDWEAALDLTNAIPIGLEAKLTGAYDTGAGTVTAKLDERCTGAFDGVVTADFITISSSFDTPAITAAAIANTPGGYTLTIQKGSSPVNLASGDTITFQVQKKTGAKVDYISGLIKLIVA